ncbi:dipeptidase, partial [Lentilactobacillus buchneri ATCC 11577]
MKIAGFGVEEWLNKWEKSATYDISQSTIASMTMNEALSLDGK